MAGEEDRINYKGVGGKGNQAIAYACQCGITQYIQGRIVEIMQKNLPD